MPNLCSFVCDRHTEMGLVIDMKQSMIDDLLCGFSSTKEDKTFNIQGQMHFLHNFAFSHDENEDEMTHVRSRYFD